MAAMATETAQQTRGTSGEPIVNDVVITVATANGTGSQSANLILMRSIFNMGIPVSGKNMFPSNIQGLPTWFTVRANHEGWTARREHADVYVVMNPESAAEDLAGLLPGTIVILHSKLKPFLNRDDLQVYEVPFDKLVKDACPNSRLRKMVVNILYVGVLAYLLDIDAGALDQAIRKQFSEKPKAADLNADAAKAGFDWAAENLEKDPQKYRLERSTATDGKIIIEGNQATGLGLMYGGINMLAWYPITPSSSVCEAAIDYLEQYRRDPETGKATFGVIQAEDELASIAMVIGAGWAGARAATATAGPGISLMSEIVGLSYFAEIPAVIVDVQRMGPSTGLPTRTSQGDVMKAHMLSHGDCRHPLMIPGNVSECYEFAAESMNLAERLQTLVFVMTDLDLGMNSWMSDPFEPITKEIDRGKVLNAEELEKVEEFARYRDVDGDGIPYRTIPGTDHPKAGYFTRGTGHTDAAIYSEKPHHWQENIDRLKRKQDTSRELLPQPIIDSVDGAEIGIIAYGSSDMPIGEARHILERDHGIKTNYLRLRAIPVAKAVHDFIDKHEKIFIVEQNRDAQAKSIIQLDKPEATHKLFSILHYNGLPLDALTVVNGIKDKK